MKKDRDSDGIPNSLSFFIVISTFSSIDLRDTEGPHLFLFSAR